MADRPDEGGVRSFCRLEILNGVARLACMSVDLWGECSSKCMRQLQIRSKRPFFDRPLRGHRRCAKIPDGVGKHPHRVKNSAGECAGSAARNNSSCLIQIRSQENCRVVSRVRHRPQRFCALAQQAIWMIRPRGWSMSRHLLKNYRRRFVTALLHR